MWQANEIQALFLHFDLTITMRDKNGDIDMYNPAEKHILSAGWRTKNTKISQKMSFYIENHLQ